MGIEVIKIDITTFKEDVYPIYKEVFPSYERKNLKIIKDLVKEGCTTLYKFENDGEFIGFSIIHQTDNNPYIMVEYFAILPAKQNKGFGTNCAKKIKDIYKKDYKGITVEVEKPDNKDMLKERRIKFYERLGLRKINAEYSLFDVEFCPYVWEFKEPYSTDKDIINSMFEIYKKTPGEELTEKYCKVLTL